ncbi:putative methyltransferase-domain-containing protein [Endogone sp. FLAS-F59071]|nr:putative methyltransferase-domain-containing protein [Endogone sp. FLAS-F59071]|eukprot:RUS16698.1 putative methyltransferase-domain-containing protein [Endogone sp. FLAS-F59071]
MNRPTPVTQPRRMHSSGYSTRITPAPAAAAAVVANATDDGNDDFKLKLHGQFMLYRLYLVRSICPTVHLNRWYRLNLALINECNLFRHQDMEPDGAVRLQCEFLVRNPAADADELYAIEARPMQDEVWAFDGAVEMEWPGFKGRGKGGLEYRVVRRKGWEGGAAVPPLAVAEEKYIHVFPDPQVEHSVNVLPLVVGPLTIIDELDHELDHALDPDAVSLIGHGSRSPSPAAVVPTLPTNEIPTQFWDAEDSLYVMYRAFPVPDLREKTSAKNGCAVIPMLLINELSDGGIPGKVWDSAYVLSGFFSNMISRNLKWMEGKHIVDLSAGTGFVGLFLASIASTLPHPTFATATMTPTTPHITITDLPHALAHIHKNLRLNAHLIARPARSARLKIRSLAWGCDADVRALRPCDVVIASDVIYETTLFADLVKTLVALSIPGRTRVYIGYKRRGLEREDEAAFFRMCREHFDITVIGGEAMLAQAVGLAGADVDDDEGAMLPDLAKKSGVFVCRMMRRVR